MGEPGQLCECGCGQPAPIAKATNRRKGHVKGEPTRFVSGHNGRGKPKAAETRRRMAEYARTRPAAHHEKLVEARRRRPATSDCPADIHAWLSRTFPKRGWCEECGTVGKTDYAFLRHPAPHTRDRGDYRELCRRCHTALDASIGIRPLWRGVPNQQRIRKQSP